MSSSTSVSRARSLRQPSTRTGELSQKDGASTRSQTRNTSPSRLPKKPLTRSATTTSATTSSSTTSRTRTSSSTTGRPLSGTYGSRVSSARGADNATNTTTTKPLGRAPSTRQPSSSATATASRTSSTSTSRPRSSGGPTTAPKERQLGHTRAKSTVTSLTAATTLRPRPSKPSPPSSAPGTPTTASFAINSSTKPVTRSQTHHARAKSQTVAAAAAAPLQPVPPQPHHRPAFNTNQQHYSPAKSLAPKPLTSTFLAPPSPSKLPTNVALSAETSRLQTELLQLSLLHRDAPAVDAEWHASARQKLAARFARLAAESDSLADAERAGVEARNVAALVRWGNQQPRRDAKGLEARLQVLDQVLNGVWSLGEPGGRYERVARAFEVWAEQMSGIVAAQRGGDASALVISGKGEKEEEVLFVSELDRGWMADCAVLVRKLESWQKMLRELGDFVVDEDEDANNGAAVGGQPQAQARPTGPARMLRGCRALVHDMLAELTAMQQIERDAAAAEDAWIRGAIRELDDAGNDDDAPQTGSGTGTGTTRRNAPLWKLAV
ncbi:hypothetical protein F4779DRAFT_639581 [Xylariaceae sp. FL0662B]|nr:hypothetical protein F4779DRAFT_639581 [Xylariaceae sp. FL0662B]